jgi:hypothetical protein
MDNCTLVDTPMDVGLKLSKDEAGKPVSAALYRQLVGS